MTASRTLILLLLSLLPALMGLQSDEGVASTGNIPLIDLGTGTYQGFEGGLYPGGKNAPPQGHLQSALEQARFIQPLGPTGEPDAERGLIVMLAIGLSNAAHEFARFERQEDANPLRNSRLVLVNGGQAGQSSDTIVDPEAQYWELMRNRLKALDLTPAQVQVVWLRERRAPAYLRLKTRGKREQSKGRKRVDRTFPAYTHQLRDDLAGIVQIIRSAFPNVRLCYLSDRTYQGYKGREPEAYEAGFAIKWLIEDQMGGNEALNWRAQQGQVRAPLLLWGPYLWADGETPNGVGTQWLREDFEQARLEHPSRSGEQKVADLLSAFFAGDATAAPWFSNPGGTTHLCLDAIADAHVSALEPGINFGLSSTLLTSASRERAVSYLRFDLSEVHRPVLHAKLSLRNVESEDQGGPRSVFLVSEDGWEESTLSFETAPELGTLVGTIPRASRDGTRSLGITAAVNEHGDSTLTVAVTALENGHPSRFRSREGGAAPRLVIVERPQGE